VAAGGTSPVPRARISRARRPPADKAKPTRRKAPRTALLHIDRLGLSEGAAAEIVRGSLLIEGWALAPGRVKSVSVTIDGRLLGDAFYGIRRRDVAEAYPDWEGADQSGFGLIVPAGAIGNGHHRIAVQVRDATGLCAEQSFTIEVEETEIDGALAVRRKISLAEVQLARAILSRLDWCPYFGLLLGIGEVDGEVASARRTLASLRDQAYDDWHVTVVRRGRVLPERCAARLLDGFGDIADRIDIRLDVAVSTPLAELAAPRAGRRPPDLIGVLLAGDVLGCDALLEMAVASGLNAEAELFYSDERRMIDPSGRMQAFLKPQWSPDLLTATNYVGRFWCALNSLFQRAQASLGEWLQYGDYDLVLRCTEATTGIHHVPKVLCQRGRWQLDHPRQEVAALERVLTRRGIAGEVSDGCAPGHYRLRRTVDTEALVSIIIPTCAAGGLINTCIETLRARTAYRHFEIICVENIPSAQREEKAWLRKNADAVVAGRQPFNWSRFNNLAAKKAKGHFLLFLNDDIEIIEPGWLEALIEHAQRPEVGVVGARLLYPDRKVQHAGMFWTPRGGRHAFRFAPETDPGYFGLAQSERNVTMVTGACMMVRRAEFEAMGGFDEKHTIINNDVDYCLRSWERGKLVVYTPHATLIHHEEASRHRLGENFDGAAFASRWRRRLDAGDPFHHPYLSLDRDDYVDEPEPVELVYPLRPMFDRVSFRNILVVKLDHIGDFITAIPALRRLQRTFPLARLHLLAAPGTRAFTGFVPEIVELIEFEFFHSRSGLGQRELMEEELAALRRQLEPFRFDLAVDFRKWPETRPILQLTGARWLAGFDHGRQFPWLDIVKDWEGDPARLRKRSHVSDDLLGLVDAIANAAEPNDATLQVKRAGNTTKGREKRRLVVVHPGAGTAIKQWPAEHYVTLIDQLLATHDVDIALIGSHDEAPVADQIIAGLERPALVRSLVGELGLAELPDFLATAALFVGNDSGPKHIAAGLGTPTVGVHAGTVDAREWGPSGPYAVAIRRNMICSPCYLSDAAQCWRGLACLTELKPAAVYEICNRLLALGFDEVSTSQNIAGPGG
jgi:ADP-heptose:LPS heptosyltransferase/GT2 family glycosyltransferase